MDFRVVTRGAVADVVGQDEFLLQPMEWNDWWEFRTLFLLYYLDRDGKLTDIGAVKIAKLDHTYSNSDAHRTPLKESFTRLGSDYVSLGQDESYYQTLRSILGVPRSHAVLRSLKDLALDLDRFESVRVERVVSQSLLRNFSGGTVRGAFNRIITTGMARAVYDFTYFRPSLNPIVHDPLRLQFAVVPESTPPTNVHVLIGRNGSGKTTVLRSMARVMLGEEVAKSSDGYITSELQGGEFDVANLVYIAFSAFDEAELPVEDSTNYEIPYAYVGLQHKTRPASYDPSDLDDEEPEEGASVFAEDIYTRPPEALESAFAASAWSVVIERSSSLWRAALKNLESDHNFKDADVSRLADIQRSTADRAEFMKEARALFHNLSSGHKIVLLTVTRLVETVSEKTLVLLDEPEGHLHPPLLSAFTRALSQLMQQRNGVAIVATHSPVILQEVPRSSVWRLRRSGNVQSAERPTYETFGENVGTLTNQVFGLEVTESGFHKMLIQAAEQLGSYESVLDLFEHQLGFEARAVLRAWFASR